MDFGSNQEGQNNSNVQNHQKHDTPVTNKWIKLSSRQLALLIIVVTSFSSVATQYAGLPQAIMSHLASGSAQAPKMNASPLVQLDTGSKYYEIMVDSLATNLKKTIRKEYEKSFSLNNITSFEPINVISTEPNQQVSLVDFHIEGLTFPSITNVYVNKKNLKLHVTFYYRLITIKARCVSLANSEQRSGVDDFITYEAGGWNASWSANLMSMIGRDNFDPNRVYTSYTRKGLVGRNSKQCKVSSENLKNVFLERIKSTVDKRLFQVMENVIMHQDQVGETSNQDGVATQPEVKPGIARGKRWATSNKAGNSHRIVNPFVERDSQSPINTNLSPDGQTKPKILKRVKRQTPCKEGEELDDYVDQLFRFGSRIIRAMEPMTLPNTTIELPDYNLKIFLYEGKGTRAYKLKRVKPAWVFCNNDTISLGITVEVEEVQVAYKYRVISGYRLLFDGDLEARLTPRAQAQFSQLKQEEDSEEPVQQRVDRVRLFRLGKVRVIIRGLGNLTQSLSMMINSYLNDNQDDLQPTFRMAEGDAVKLINRLLANVNVPLLSVV